MRRITNLSWELEGLHPGWWSRHIKKNMYKFSMNSTHARLKMCICAQGGIIWGLRKGKACINALMQNFQHVWLLFSHEKYPLSLPSLQNDILHPSLRLCCNAEFSAWCIFYSHPPPPPSPPLCPSLEWDIKLTTFPRGTTYYNNLTISFSNHVGQNSFGKRDCP